MSDLKPCPFCGGDASYGTKYAHCLSCSDRFHSINDWNTRPIEDKLRADLDKAMQALGESRAEAQKYEVLLKSRLHILHRLVSAITDVPEDELHSALVYFDRRDEIIAIAKHTLAELKAGGCDE